VTLLKVTGVLPKTFEKRIRMVLLHRSGLTIERNVWSTALAPAALVALGTGRPGPVDVRGRRVDGLTRSEDERLAGGA